MKNGYRVRLDTDVTSQKEGDYGLDLVINTYAGTEPFGGFLQNILHSQQSLTDTSCFLVA